MSTVVFEKHEAGLGARVAGVDAARFREDERLADACVEALEQYSVLVFPELFIDDAAHVAFSRRLGVLQSSVEGGLPGFPEIQTVSLDPAKNIGAEYFKGSFLWHTDGVLKGIPNKVSVLSMRRLSDQGGDTEFASTDGAYGALNDNEKQGLATLRVVHSMEAQQRRIYADPTPEQVASWRRFPPTEHPLVWQHESGRRSLLLGSSASHVVGVSPEEGNVLLTELEARATTPDNVYRHVWSRGDVV